ncbi:hypothetical protein CTAM01_07334 [Colletotrichum tamarilloi]|uniref:Glyceraldehyde-3-phosphate dehydrogenase n=1 Tax=Colletotrichum tamarilloi TaxID=1209934 RepID=A0ABQ9R9M7_9PEZI|nr:uncharacterized protein CTAM01_07334 [Colletotrichum tamarilloi]KAK1498605.1 hypothetical protein CTAM01_07334 [Colletotrichum tamarilloi]
MLQRVNPPLVPCAARRRKTHHRRVACACLALQPY